MQSYTSSIHHQGYLNGTPTKQISVYPTPKRKAWFVTEWWFFHYIVNSCVLITSMATYKLSRSTLKLWSWFMCGRCYTTRQLRFWKASIEHTGSFLISVWICSRNYKNKIRSSSNYSDNFHVTRSCDLKLPYEKFKIHLYYTAIN